MLNNLGKLLDPKLVRKLELIRKKVKNNKMNQEEAIKHIYGLLPSNEKPKFKKLVRKMEKAYKKITVLSEKLKNGKYKLRCLNPKNPIYTKEGTVIY